MDRRKGKQVVRERRWSDIHQEYRWANTLDSKESPMTEAQGERIIELLERLVWLTMESLDKEIAEDFKRRSVSYPGGV